jgi:hypothetical protein
VVVDRVFGGTASFGVLFSPTWESFSAQTRQRIEERMQNLLEIHFEEDFSF